MQEDFKKIVNIELNRKDLPSIVKKRLEEAIYAGRDRYANETDANVRSNMVQGLYGTSATITEIEETKLNILDSLSDEQVFGKNPARKFSKRFGSALLDFATGNMDYELKDDQPVFNMPNPYGSGNVDMHLHELEDFVNSKKIDEDSQKAINMLIDDVNKGGDFNRDGMFRNIRNNIVVKGNLESLINDDIFGGRNFRDDFIESTMMSSYKDFDENLKDEKISFEDAVAIFEELLKNRDQTIDYVAEYFTKFAEQNRTKPNLQNQEEAGYDPYEFA